MFEKMKVITSYLHVLKDKRQVIEKLKTPCLFTLILCLIVIKTR